MNEIKKHKIKLEVYKKNKLVKIKEVNVKIKKVKVEFFWYKGKVTLP